MKFEEKKLHIPNYTSSLKRNRLYTEFDKYKNASLIMVTGDSGYGKTTLVSNYVRDRNIPTIWYQLEGLDRFAHIFLSHLKTGISRVIEDENHPNIVEPNNVDTELKAVQSLFANRSTPLFIVLDDYQWVEQSPEIEPIIMDLLNSSSQWVTIVIISRVLPKIPVSRLKVEQKYKHLTTSDLAFTFEETISFFNELNKLNLEKSEIQLIYERSEGWIACYQLILGIIGKMNKQERFLFWSTFPNFQDIYDYLSMEVLQAQPNEVKSFLYKTSLLSTLDPLIINEFLHVNDSNQILNHLLKHHLFIYRDDQGNIRYHRLFRQFLYKNYKMLKGNEFLNIEHLNLGAIYEKRYQLINAFAHYTIGNDYLKAAKVMGMIKHRYNPVESMLFLEGWLEEISAGESLAYNTLFLIRCIPLSTLDELTTLFEHNISLHKNEKNELWVCNLQHRLAVIYFMRGNILKAKQLFKESLKGAEKFHDHPIAALNLILLGEIYRFFGKYSMAAEYVRKALYISDKYGIKHTQIQALDELTLLYLDENKILDEAIPYAQQALNIALKHDRSSLIFAYTTMGRIYYTKGDYSQAIDWGKKAVELAKNYNVDFDIGWSNLELGKTYMGCKQYDKAESCLIKAYGAFSLFTYYKCLVGVTLYQFYILARKAEHAKKIQQDMIKLCQEHNYYWVIKELGISDTKIVVNQPQPQLSIQTLGKFNIIYNNKPIFIKRRASLRLLQYFITNRNKRIEKDIIIDCVFSDGSIDNIENHFNVSLSVLRKTLEPGLTSGINSRYIKRFNNQYLFDTTETDLDVEKFLAFTKDDDISDENMINFHHAEQLYHGDYFEEYPYEEFLERERENLRLSFIKMKRLLAHHYYQKEDYTKSFLYFEEILNKDSYQEEIYHEYIELLLQQNLISKANKIAKDMKNFFEKEIGINVQNQLLELFSKYNIQLT